MLNCLILIQSENKMKYKVIFTLGVEYDEYEMSLRGCRNDVLVQDLKGNYFELNFETIEIVNDYFVRGDLVYFWDKLIIVKDISKKSICESINHLHIRQFYKIWQPITQEYLEEHYYPKEKWEIFAVEVDDVDEM